VTGDTGRVADALWGPDGTQPLPPQPTWADPLAGLVTGAVYDPERLTVHVEKPPMPDMSEVRKAVDAVFAGEDEPVAPAAPKAVRKAQFAAPLEEMPGMGPNPRPGWPRTPSGRQRPGLRPPAARVGPQPQVTRGAARRAQGFSAGVGGVVVIIVVIIVIIATIIGSLVETVNDILK
jgi:hypothetical protein